MDVRQVIPKDAIPSVDDPTFADDYPGDRADEVIVVESRPARAYPVTYLHYHEVVNDVVDGDPLAVTWCPLCASAVVYERTVAGRTLTFGVSGKLADDDLVLYDRETDSEWKQSLGACIAGPLEGERLTVRPAAMTTWARFDEAHPDGVVLEPPGGESEAASDDASPAAIDYDAEPYRAYFRSEEFGLDAHRGGSGRTWDRNDLHPKDVVLGIEAGGEALAFPARRVENAGGVVETTVGDLDVVVVATDDGIHAYENPGYSFELAEDGGLRADGTRWDAATGRDDGRRLDRVPAKRLFAFAWQDDHGPASFFEP